MKYRILHNPTWYFPYKVESYDAINDRWAYVDNFRTEIDAESCITKSEEIRTKNKTTVLKEYEFDGL